jgi:hypothetical protein
MLIWQVAGAPREVVMAREGEIWTVGSVVASIAVAWRGRR